MFAEFISFTSYTTELISTADIIINGVIGSNSFCILHLCLISCRCFNESLFFAVIFHDNFVILLLIHFCDSVAVTVTVLYLPIDGSRALQWPRF